MPTQPAVDPVSGLPADGTAALDHLALLADLQHAFADGIATADPGAPVPACEGWRVRDLVEHLAGVHRWAAGQARREETSSPEAGPVDLVSFYVEQAALLRSTLADLGPHATSWTLPGSGPVTFWWRRQVHETLVHLHDLRAAAAGTADAAEDDPPVAPEVWADGVDEIVTMFQPRQVRLGRMPSLPRTVRLEATDIGRTWVLGAHEDERAGRVDDEPVASVQAPARGLDLLLWRRLTLAEAGARVTGDAAALSAVLADAVVP